MALRCSVLPLLPRPLLPLLLLLLSGAASLPAGATPGSLSAYDVLQSYNFPVGLLPQGVVGYDLDRGTGSFSAYLNGTCSFSVEGSYQLRYRSTISGYISKNQMRDLQGVSVKVLLFWVNIVEVTRTDNELEFSVGIASADFTVDDFLQCPQCGCGFNCPSVPLATGKEGPRVNWTMVSS